MNFIKEVKAYKEEEQFEQNSEEEEEEEERDATTTSNSSKHITFPSPSSSNSPPFIYRNFLPHHSQEFHPPTPIPHSGSLHFHDKLDFMDFSLSNNNHNNNNIAGAASADTGNMMVPIEKENMFDKVVTPSDVGKLNRLVIPKQHAEKYLPLDASSNEKGMLLNFEDRNGKSWRFRYSYWNSSQSYVMTKGWSRFVKEKKLDAGDIVSFQRGVGEEGRHRLFIDWRRRPNDNSNNVHYPHFPAHLELQNQMNFRWGNRLLYSLPYLQNFPPPPRSHPPRTLLPPHQFHYSNLGSSCYNVQHCHNYQFYGRGNAGSYYGRLGGGNQDDDVASMVIDSVPVVHGRTVGKRLRLFGVNMDCPIVPSGSNTSGGVGEELEESHLVGRPTTHGLISANNPINAGGSSLQLRLPSGSWGGGSSGSGSGSGSGVLPMANMHSHELSKKGKTSLSFDLDL